MARSSRVCGISGAQSFKILRQITAAADCGQRADVGSWSMERGLWGRRAHERGRSLVGKTLATCGQHLLGGIACGSRHEAGMMRERCVGTRGKVVSPYDAKYGMIAKLPADRLTPSKTRRPPLPASKR